eukprot:TRINITY_DN16248_c0_g2_i2.p1 TRINITY_DN16248_c0_g2~~TRINITY_DN16248_c0_g2_i2.p1  ORF type:complete len:1051 (+),score=70.37 TRINITY_DN16248_c0_g2_i2:34-3186(+)
MPYSDDQRLVYANLGVRDFDSDALPAQRDYYSYQELDFSQNNLSVRGLEQILDICYKCKDLRVLKLYKNDLGDNCAEVLAAFLNKCDTIQEVHLSHNRFSTEGATVLVEAAARSRLHGSSPLWLRLERNDIGDTAEFLRDMEQQYGVCPRRPGCTQFHCCVGSRVHLPFMDVERSERERRTGDWSRVLLREASPTRVTLTPAVPSEAHANRRSDATTTGRDASSSEGRRDRDQRFGCRSRSPVLRASRDSEPADDARLPLQRDQVKTSKSLCAVPNWRQVTLTKPKHTRATLRAASAPAGSVLRSRAAVSAATRPTVTEAVAPRLRAGGFAARHRKSAETMASASGRNRRAVEVPRSGASSKRRRENDNRTSDLRRRRDDRTSQSISGYAGSSVSDALDDRRCREEVKEGTTASKDKEFVDKHRHKARGTIKRAKAALSARLHSKRAAAATVRQSRSGGSVATSSIRKDKLSSTALQRVRQREALKERAHGTRSEDSRQKRRSRARRRDSSGDAAESSGKRRRIGGMEAVKRQTNSDSRLETVKSAKAGAVAPDISRSRSNHGECRQHDSAVETKARTRERDNDRRHGDAKSGDLMTSRKTGRKIDDAEPKSSRRHESRPRGTNSEKIKPPAFGFSSTSSCHKGLGAPRSGTSRERSSFSRHDVKDAYDSAPAASRLSHKKVGSSADRRDAVADKTSRSHEAKTVSIDAAERKYSTTGSYQKDISHGPASSSSSKRILERLDRSSERDAASTDKVRSPRVGTSASSRVRDEQRTSSTSMEKWGSRVNRPDNDRLNGSSSSSRRPNEIAKQSSERNQRRDAHLGSASVGAYQAQTATASGSRREESEVGKLDAKIDSRKSAYVQPGVLGSGGSVGVRPSSALAAQGKGRSNVAAAERRELKDGSRDETKRGEGLTTGLSASRGQRYGYDDQHAERSNAGQKGAFPGRSGSSSSAVAKPRPTAANLGNSSTATKVRPTCAGSVETRGRSSHDKADGSGRESSRRKTNVTDGESHRHVESREKELPSSNLAVADEVKLLKQRLAFLTGGSGSS